MQTTDRLPADFPDGQGYGDQKFEADIQAAPANRPETQFLEFVRE